MLETRTSATIAGSTVAEALRFTARALRDGGIESPARDARLLLAAAVEVEPLDIIRDPDRALSGPEAAALSGLLARRLAHEPVSRILGRRAFYGREFAVTPATLDPRPDSETLIEMALEISETEDWRNRPIRILDIGTGTGCLLITLLSELPLATGLGTDIEPDALKVAQQNALRLGVGGRADFKVHRSLTGVSGPFDLLVSNPPYIPAAEIDLLEADVRQFDPRASLDGGPDGLAVYRDIAAGLSRVVPRGVAILEVGAGQSTAVSALFSAEFVRQIRQKTDLGGHERCVAVWTQS